MTTIPLTDAKARLNELVEETARTHERITITRHGRPAVMLIAVEDLEAMEETMFWQAQPTVHEDIESGRAAARPSCTTKPMSGVATASVAVGEWPAQKAASRPGPSGLLSPLSVTSTRPRLASRPAIIEFLYGPLADNSHRVGKPLRDDLAGSFGARRGSYRVLYDIDDDEREVRVFRIASRSTSYRRR